MKYFFLKFAIYEHIYTLSISCILLILSFFFPQTPILQLIRIFAFIAFVFEVLNLIIKYHRIVRFLKTHPVSENIRTIENAAFMEDGVMAYDIGRHGPMYYLTYDSMELARHNYNVYEQVRPGYRGNHKVVLQSGDTQILISVENEEIAEKILNFIQTKNPAVTFYHKTSPFTPVKLEELENWKVKGRF